MEYTWNAENRLVSVEPGDYADGAPDGSLRALFAYDYLGRRVSQVVETYNAATQSWTPSSQTVYLWSGWLLLAELEPDVLPNPTTCNLLRSYTWGLDLAGAAGSGVWCGVFQREDCGAVPSGSEAAGCDEVTTSEDRRGLAG